MVRNLGRFMKKQQINLLVRALFFSFLTSSAILAGEPGYKIEFGGIISGIDLTSSAGEKPTGIGVRIGYELTRNLKIEGEFFYCPENPGGNFGQTLSFAGLRAGISNRRGGGFLKVRPGTIYYGGSFFKAYNGSSRANFALDLGIALEYYPSARIILRLDSGYAIIPFGDEAIRGPLPPYTIRPGTTHNRLSSIGVGLRF